MTKEQIKQNAEEYANTHKYALDESNNSILTVEEIIKLAYNVGAHSRDEEVERLEDKLAKQSVLLEERGLIKFANLNAQFEIELLQLRAELAKTKNPWRKGLPTEDGEYLVECGYYKCGKLHTYHMTLYWKHDEWINECLGDFVLRWMPIPSVND